MSISIKFYTSRSSHLKCSILSFYCNVLFTGCPSKKTLKRLLHRERLRITQETLQISLFASMFLSLVKKTCCKEDPFLLLYCPMCRALYEREFEPPNSQSMSKEKSRNIANIGIQSYITKFSQKCFILSVYCTALFTKRFEPTHSSSMSKKN